MKKALVIAAVLGSTGLLHAIEPIVSTNIVGFAVVTNVANQANTIITVPFETCLSNGVDGVVADLVSTNGLKAGSDAASADQLVVLTTNASGLVYYYYYLHAGYGWTNVTSEQLMPGGTNALLTPLAANAFQISRGLGFWLKRNTSASASTVFVKGQVSTNLQSTEIKPGLNLIGFASGMPVDLNTNNVNWTGACGGNGNTMTMDQILLIGTNGIMTPYYYFTNQVGVAWEPYNAVLSNKWITSSYAVATNAIIPAGKGFWYVRRGGTPFTFQPGQ